MQGFSVNEIELSYKRKVSPGKLPVIDSANKACSVLMNQWDENRIDFIEDFKILLLNRSLRLIGIYHVSSGSTAAALVDPKLVFVAALKANASSIILAHNHPSGNPNPSEQDRKLTEKLKNGGRLLDITVNDHLIITSEGCYSMANERYYHGEMSKPDHSNIQTCSKPYYIYLLYKNHTY